MKLDTQQLLSFIEQQGLAQDKQNEALSSVFRKLLDFFNCDRAWCLYPCDPETEYWGVPIEQTRHVWPGLKNVELDMPAVEEDIAAFNLFLNAKKPVTFGYDADYSVPDHIQKVFKVRSQIATVVYPKQGKPWVLGIHFCEAHHQFSDDEIEFFDLLGKNFAEVFDSLLF